jgi:hypothetical protein
MTFNEFKKEVTQLDNNLSITEFENTITVSTTLSRGFEFDCKHCSMIIIRNKKITFYQINGSINTVKMNGWNYTNFISELS